MPEVGAVIGTLLRSRRCCAVIAALATAQVVAVKAGLPGWPCLVLKLTGWPCAGCGLSRSVAATAAGRLGEAIGYHLFGPVVAVLVALLTSGALVRDQRRLRVARWVGRVERAGATLAVLGAMLAYWALRLGLGGVEHVRVMTGQ